MGRPCAGAVGRRRVRVSEVDPKICRRIRREVLRRGRDRRKVYCLTMDGEVGTLERFTDVCSGCRCDCGDGYPCSHGAGGCDECGYTGKRVTLFGVPVPAKRIAGGCL